MHFGHFGIPFGFIIDDFVFFNPFYPAEFTPDGVLSSLYSYVHPYVRRKFFLRFLAFWDHQVSSSWRFFHFLKKMIFWAGHALFLTIFSIYKGLLGACCKKGDLGWNGFVCRFWIYKVVRPDLFFVFFKKAFVSPTD